MRLLRWTLIVLVALAFVRVLLGDLLIPTMLAGAEVAPQFHPFVWINFRIIRGNDGCNRFFGTYEPEGDHYRLHVGASTRAGCRTAGPFHRAISSLHYKPRGWIPFFDDALTLRDEAGAVIAKFVRVIP